LKPRKPKLKSEAQTQCQREKKDAAAKTANQPTKSNKINQHFLTKLSTFSLTHDKIAMSKDNNNTDGANVSPLKKE
jgi:hypothetical protein